mgnify:CR=1 FL=1
MLMSVCGHTGMKEGKEMNVKYMNELPAGLKEHRETKTSKLLAVMQDFMARPEPIMEVAWEEAFHNVTSAAASARSAIRSNKLALRVTRCQNRLFIRKEAADAE